MSTEQTAPPTTTDDFFHRAGLAPPDRLDCYAFVEQLYPGRHISPVTCQGYCSMTLFVGDDIIVQFRPSQYRLDLRITEAATEIYSSFAPETKYVATLPGSGLLVYNMTRIGGISLQDFRESASLSTRSTAHRAILCKDFAALLSRSWRRKRDTNTSLPLGVVGKSLLPRLTLLSTTLPLRFRPTARTLLDRLPQIEALPWVLTHGDIVPSNLMVDASSGHLTGLVDWAEAEYLPFGVCLHGLEEILGEMTTAGFEYYADADELRGVFWAELGRFVPELRGEGAPLEAVNLARDLGVLLWHGIAFDNGAIDRVVEEGRDVGEVCRLDAFLDICKQPLLDSDSNG